MGLLPVLRQSSWDFFKRLILKSNITECLGQQLKDAPSHNHFLPFVFFSISLLSLLSHPHHFFKSPFLRFGTKRCSSLIFYFPSSNPRISCFSRSSCLFLVKNGIHKPRSWLGEISLLIPPHPSGGHLTFHLSASHSRPSRPADCSNESRNQGRLRAKKPGRK